MEANPVHAGWQKLARLSAGTILYQCRIARAQKQVLDVLGHVLCELIESLFKNSLNYASGTPSLILYEGIDGQLISLRPGPDFVHEARIIIDLALTSLSVQPADNVLLTGLSGNSWNPEYGLAELLEYLQVQSRFTEGQHEHLRKLLDNHSISEHPKSIFENNGIINVAYSLIPRPVKCLELIPQEAVQSTIGSKRSLDTIVEDV